MDYALVCKPAVLAHTQEEKEVPVTQKKASCAGILGILR